MFVWRYRFFETKQMNNVYPQKKKKSNELNSKILGIYFIWNERIAKELKINNDVEITLV